MVLTLFLFSTRATCQTYAGGEYSQDIDGTPFFARTYVDVNGNPYLFDDFETANITLFNGRVLKNVKTNFNLVTNEFLFIDEKGATMIGSILLIKAVETGTRKFIPLKEKKMYCEVISGEGKATLLRIYKKRIVETKAFNSATAQKDFVLSDSHAVLIGENLTNVKSADDLYEVLGSEELKDYAKKEKLKAKSVNSWIKIVNYYNSI
ncbi:MAG: hypothetical protein WDO14_11745 [Bacteroidota bacterium]